MGEARAFGAVLLGIFGLVMGLPMLIRDADVAGGMLVVVGVLHLFMGTYALLPADFGGARGSGLLSAAATGVVGVALGGWWLTALVTDGNGAGVVVLGAFCLLTFWLAGWLLVESQPGARLANRFMTEEDIRGLLGEREPEPTDGVAVRRVDRVFATARFDVEALARALPKGERRPTIADQRAGRSIDPVYPSRAAEVAPIRVARCYPGLLGGEACLVVLWWRDDRSNQIEMATYAWDNAASDIHERAFRLVESRLGEGWRTMDTVDQAERWWIRGVLRERWSGLARLAGPRRP